MVDRDRTEPTEVALPADVVERIEARLPRTRFDSVDAYAASALDLLLREVATADGSEGDRASTDDGGAPDGESAESATEDAGTAHSDTADGRTTDGGATDDGGVTDPADREAVEDQLESLGYL